MKKAFLAPGQHISILHFEEQNKDVFFNCCVLYQSKGTSPPYQHILSTKIFLVLHN